MPASASSHPPGHRTLARPVTASGIGLHSGAPVHVRLVPSERVGLVFVRTDLPGIPEVAADLAHIAGTTHATTLQREAVTVGTPEHLLAALWASGVTACRIELSASEVPILDGSALPWLELIRAGGEAALPGLRPRLALAEPVWWEGGGASVLGLPYPGFRLSAAVNFDAPHAGAQCIDLEVTPESFAQELAPARTFALETWLPHLQQAGLIRGGSTGNAILISSDGPSSPWRLPNELARHKALDAVGDLALLAAPTGAVFAGHLIAVRAGHGAHAAWMRAFVRVVPT